MKKLALALLLAAILAVTAAGSVFAQGPAAQPACDNAPAFAQGLAAADFSFCFVPPAFVE